MQIATEASCAQIANHVVTKLMKWLQRLSKKNKAVVTANMIKVGRSNVCPNSFEPLLRAVGDRYLGEGDHELGVL